MVATGMCLSASIPSMANDYVSFVKKGRSLYLIDETGKVLTQEPISKVYNFYNNYAIVLKNNKWQYISSDGRIFSPPENDKLGEFSDNRGAFLSAGKWGFVDNTGTVVIQPTYQSVKVFRDGKCWVKKDNQWFPIDHNGKEVFPQKFDAFHYYYEGIARVRMIDKWGFIDQVGEYIAGGIIYEKNEPFYAGKAFVKKDGSWGVIDKSGNFLLKPQYSQASQFLEEGYAIVKKDDKTGMINDDLETVIPFEYDRIRPIKNGFCGAKSISGWDIYKADGTKIASGLQSYKDFQERTSIIRKEGKTGILTASGEIKLLGTYDKIDPFVNGFASVCNLGKWGYINSRFEEIVAPQYISARDFFTDNAIIRGANGKYGFIDTTGKITIPPQFDLTTEFVRNVQADKEYTCDRSTKTFVSMAPAGLRGLASQTALIFSEKDMVPTDITRAKYHGKWNYINKQGEFVLETLDNAEMFINGFARFRKDGKWGIIDQSGKVVVEPKYQYVQDMYKICED